MQVLRRAFASYLDGDVAEALRLARRALRLNPGDATAQMALQNFRRRR
jgi:Flp pilus assembly protein TadD